MAEVNTERQHWKCKKCQTVVKIYENKKGTRCPEGGNCIWEKQHVSWDYSALGFTVNLIVRLMKKLIAKIRSR